MGCSLCPTPKLCSSPPSAAVPETEPTEPGPLGKCGSHLSPANTTHPCIPPPCFQPSSLGVGNDAMLNTTSGLMDFSPLSEPACIFGGGKQPEPALALIADCREEQYPCTRLYSVHKPCKQCLNEICFYRQAQGLPLSPLPPSPLAQRRIWVVFCFVF